MDNNVIVDTDKAYTLGLILGGGEIVNNRLIITLPYRHWGSISINPQRGGEISEYIMSTLKPLWKNTYGVEIFYMVEKESWKIYCEVNEKMCHTLTALGLPNAGKIKETADIAILSRSLNNQEKIKRFIAGLTDTIGSLARSHRHRVDTNQMISFEFSGKNFQLITDLMNLFARIGCCPDQILWNHPNFHSGTNRYYGSWRKGFKLRIPLYDYMLKGNFVSRAKRLSAEENALLRRPDEKASVDAPSINGRTTRHMDESSEWLPENLRGLHFIHYTHLLYVLGGTISAAALDFLQRKLAQPERLITPFTLLTKGTRQEIENIIQKESYLRQCTYTDISFSIVEFEHMMNDKSTDMIYGLDAHRGFPKQNVLHAITYVMLAQMGGEKLLGTRIAGRFKEKFDAIKHEIMRYNLRVLKPNRGTCLLIKTNDFAALVGYVDDEFNKTLVHVDHETLKFWIDEPSYENCPLI